VNEQPHVHVAADDGVFDLIEWSLHGREVRLVELQREKGAGERSRDGDALAADIGALCRGSRDETRSVAIAHGCAVREQCVPVSEVGVCVDGDRGDLELRAQGALIERFDILQLVDVAQVAGIDFPFGERVEHERVVGIRAMGDVDGGGHCGGWWLVAGGWWLVVLPQGRRAHGCTTRPGPSVPLLRRFNGGDDLVLVPLVLREILRQLGCLRGDEALLE